MSETRPLRLAAKALGLFVFLNAAYAVLEPPVDRLTIYNWLVHGRERLPRSGVAAKYNVEPGDLDASFAAHVISASGKPPMEYRVVVLGDSATWGPLIKPAETFVGLLDRQRISMCGRQVRFFNLGYPSPDVLKDFVILSRSRNHAPDLVLWMVTKESLERVQPPQVWEATSGEELSTLFHQYGLDRFQERASPRPTLWGKTLAGQRVGLARLVQLQVHGLLWEATGIDQAELEYTPIAERREPAPGITPSGDEADLDREGSALAFDVLRAGSQMMRPVPFLVVNEPIYLAAKSRQGSRRAANVLRSYDVYRQMLQSTADEEGWSYADLSRLVPPEEFTNTIYHVNARGQKRIAAALSREILSIACP